MKKRFVAPVLRAESTLGQLTLGEICSVNGDAFDSSIICGVPRT